MFSIIYLFDVKRGQEAEFESAWRAFTTIIYEHTGSMGSRLHKQQNTNYIAYAQWPARKTWEESGNRLPESSADIRKRMRDSCNKIEVLYELDVIDDLLQKQVSSQK